MIRFSQTVHSLRTSEIRDLMSLATRPDIISFAGGMPDNGLFPIKEIEALYAKLPLDVKQIAYQYGPTSGYPPLLESLAEFLRKKNLPVDSNRLLITTGSLQAINILAKVFLDPGDIVLTEYPCFIGALSVFQSYRAVVRAVDLDDDGIRIDLLENALASMRETPPKFAYLTPNFHNPAGILYTEQRKWEVAAVLGKAGIPLIEDDAYGDLFFDEEAQRRVMPMKALYEKELPICYTGSFSKILGPGFRLGWMLVPEEIYKKAELCKQSFDACSPTYTQVLANEFLRSEAIYPYLERMRPIYRQRKEEMIAAMKKYFPADAHALEPKGGFYIWVKVPDGVDLLAVLKDSIEHGAVFVTGQTFDPEGKDNSHFRISYCNTAGEKIEKGIKIIGDALKRAMK
jgi:DNA-binding transcriptional MocR family regulator